MYSTSAHIELKYFHALSLSNYIYCM